MEKEILKLKEAVAQADTIVIGAGAGLSTSAGFTYTGERFDKHFADFHERYGFTDMDSGGFYPYKTLEENWAFWSRYIWINRYMDAPKSVYSDLLNLVRVKDYFVLTTNVDHCFQKAGFDKAGRIKKGESEVYILEAATGKQKYLTLNNLKLLGYVKKK